MRARESAYHQVRGFVGARGIPTNACRSPELLAKVAQRLYGATASELEHLAREIASLPKKERARRASRNLKRATALLPAEPVQRECFDENEDDGSQEALDRWAAADLNRFIKAVSGMIRWNQKASDEERAAAKAFMWDRFRVSV